MGKGGLGLGTAKLLHLRGLDPPRSDRCFICQLTLYNTMLGALGTGPALTLLVARMGLAADIQHALPTHTVAILAALTNSRLYLEAP